MRAWNTVAKHRRIRRLRATGRSLSTISAEFGQTVGSLRKTLREMALLDHVRGLAGWNEEEESMLTDAQLKTKAFTRFFTLEGVKPALALTFDQDGNFTSDLDAKDLNTALQFIARKLLVPAASETDNAPTRLKPAEVWREFAVANKAAAKKLKIPKTMLAPKGKNKLQGKSASFFQSLECPVKDDHLRQLTKEISTIDYSRAVSHLTA